MTTTRVTGQRARELLDGTTPAPWQAFAQMRHPDSPTYIVGPDHQRVAGSMMGDGVTHRNSRLITASPDLAGTVAWLYGREPQQGAGHESAEWHLADGFKVVREGDVIAIGDGMMDLVFDNLDEAEDAARSLLNALEEARDV